MNADLTINSIVFAKSYDDKSGSERRSTARGINTPDVMSVKRQQFTDSATKVPGTRYLVSFDRHDLSEAGEARVTRAYLVLQVPSTAEAGDVTAIVATFKAAVADADLIGDVLNSES